MPNTTTPLVVQPFPLPYAQNAGYELQANTITPKNELSLSQTVKQVYSQAKSYLTNEEVCINHNKFYDLWDLFDDYIYWGPESPKTLNRTQGKVIFSEEINNINKAVDNSRTIALDLALYTLYKTEGDIDKAKKMLDDFQRAAINDIKQAAINNMTAPQSTILSNKTKGNNEKYDVAITLDGDIVMESGQLLYDSDIVATFGLLPIQIRYQPTTGASDFEADSEQDALGVIELAIASYRDKLERDIKQSSPWTTKITGSPLFDEDDFNVDFKFQIPDPGAIDYQIYHIPSSNSYMLTKLGIKTKELRLFYGTQSSQIELPLKYSSIRRVSSAGKTYYTNFSSIVTYNRSLNNNAKVIATSPMNAYQLFTKDPMAKTIMQSHFSINGFLKVIWRDAEIKLTNKQTGAVSTYQASRGDFQF